MRDTLYQLEKSKHILWIHWPHGIELLLFYSYRACIKLPCHQPAVIITLLWGESTSHRFESSWQWFETRWHSYDVNIMSNLDPLRYPCWVLDTKRKWQASICFQLSRIWFFFFMRLRYSYLNSIVLDQYINMILVWWPSSVYTSVCNSNLCRPIFGTIDYW